MGEGIVTVLIVPPIRLLYFSLCCQQSAKAKAAKKTTAAKKAPKGKKAAKAQETDGPRGGGKTAQVVAMLKRKNGATLAEIMATTGWLCHTTRAFVSATPWQETRFGR
jgi:hypothetical protein